MSSILVINAAGRETRVALVENGHIAEFYLERKKDKGIVGNIYKGRVVRVLPGMQAAFVDVGLEKAAFLYVSDVVYDPDFARAQFELTEGEHEDAGDVPDLNESEHEHEHDRDEELHEAALENGNGHATSEPELEVREVAPGELTPPAQLEPVRRVTQEIPAISLPEEPASSAPVVVGTAQRTPTGEIPAIAMAPAAPSDPAAASPIAGEPSQAISAEIPSYVAPGQPELAPPEAVEPTDASGEAAAQAEATGSAPGAAEATGTPTSDAPAAAVAAKAQEVTGALENRERQTSNREKREDKRDREKDKRRDRERGERNRHEEKPRKEQRIEDLLKVGQEVLVQISKDPIGTKGARLTSHISIPGRHLVFMPTVDHVGISRRISNEKERRRLREIVDRLRPPGTGFIVRTVAENVPQEKLESDIRFLIEVWNQVVRRNEKRGGPGLMHPDLDLILRATRDLFAQDVEKLVIDDREEHERVLQFVTAQDPALASRVILHDSEEPVFDAYGIEQEIERATQRKVWLKSGGYLIIDQAEALTAIDVNSGRYVGKKSLEETITKINVEAAKEIVYQLRLRNIGGIIICDFIDMEKAQNRDKVFKSLQEALGRDKAKTNVLRISELGLVEMTRKRVRESIGRILHEDCGYCEGKGYIKTATTICYEIFHEIRREAPNYKDPTIVINCNGDVARLLQSEEREELRHLMDRYNKSIQVKAQQNYHREQYDLYARSQNGGDHKIAGSHVVRRMETGEAHALPPRAPERNWESRRERREGRRDRDRDRGRQDRGGDRQNRGGGERGGGERGGGERGGGERGGGERGGGERGQNRGGGGERGKNRGGGSERGQNRGGGGERREEREPSGGGERPPGSERSAGERDAIEQTGDESQSGGGTAGGAQS